MPKQKPSPEKARNQVVEEIAGLVDAFCREHLNDEYAELCRRLTEKLARKRPSPLVSGKPNTWPVESFGRLAGSTFWMTAARSPT